MTLRQINPLAILVICLAWILATTLVFRIEFQIFAIALFAGMLLGLTRVSPLVLLALMVPFALFGFGFFTTNVLFRQDNVEAVAVFSRDLARGEAWQAGLVLFLRALAGGLISIFFAFSIDPGGLVRGSMAYLKLPPRIAYALFAAMQIVPDLAAKAQALRLARSMRTGRPLRQFPTPPEIIGSIVPLLAFAVRRAGRSAIAMEARGFAPGRARTTLDIPTFGRGDAVFLALMAAALLLALWLTRTWPLLPG